MNLNRGSGMLYKSAPSAPKIWKKQSSQSIFGVYRAFYRSFLVDEQKLELDLWGMMEDGDALQWLGYTRNDFRKYTLNNLKHHVTSAIVNNSVIIKEIYGIACSIKTFVEYLTVKRQFDE